MFQPGDIFERKYIIQGLLGSGGFALVYKAHQPDLNRDVAIKVVRPAEDLGMHPTRLIKRFHREAQLAEKLRNEHNIRVLDFGRSAETGLLFMVMEFVDGVPLDRLIREGGPMAPRRVVKILRYVLEALGEAHQLGILHRDVKPGNIIIFDRLDEDDQAKLIDFGIAKPMKPEMTGEGITSEGSVVGTPRYMAPEQIIFVNSLTAATDIYSLGLVAYEMLVGVSVLGDSTHTEVIKRQLSEEVFRIPDYIPAPPGLRVIIDRMLHKSSRLRYQTTDEVIRDIDAWLESAQDEDWNVPAKPGASSEVPVTIDTVVDKGVMLIAAQDAKHEVSKSSEMTRSAELVPYSATQDVPVKTATKLVAISVAITLSVVAVAGFLLLKASGAEPERVVKRVFPATVATGNCQEDAFEPNDRSLKGTPLGDEPLKAWLCPKNVDWFVLGHHQVGDVVRIQIDYDEGVDDIDAELFIGSVHVAGAYTPESTENIDFVVDAEGLVAVRVYFPTTTSEKGRGYTIRKLK